MCVGFFFFNVRWGLKVSVEKSEQLKDLSNCWRVTNLLRSTSSAKTESLVLGAEKTRQKEAEPERTRKIKIDVGGSVELCCWNL